MIIHMLTKAGLDYPLPNPRMPLVATKGGIEGWASSKGGVEDGHWVRVDRY